MRLQAGTDLISLELPEGATVQDGLQAFDRARPELRSSRSSCMIALGVEYISPERILRDEDEVLLIPPVQGG